MAVVKTSIQSFKKISTKRIISLKITNLLAHFHLYNFLTKKTLLVSARKAKLLRPYLL